VSSCRFRNATNGFGEPVQVPDPELVSQLREKLPEALFEKLNSSLSIVRDRLKFAECKVREQRPDTKKPTADFRNSVE